MLQPLAVIPTKRSDVWWLERHQQKLQQKQAFTDQLDLLFLGDSITHAWEVEGEQAWQDYFAHHKALNLGFAGDRTEHLLWRIQNGAVDELPPKHTVILIGTNNAGHRLDSPEDIAAGVEAIVSELQQRLPSTRLILMAIFPRSRNRFKPMRQRIEKTNLLLQHLAQTYQIDWLDINALFIDEDGRLDEASMPDLLHLSSDSYAVWAKALLRFIQTKPRLK